MANTLITPDIIAKEALMQLENNLVMGNKVHREYKKEFSGGQGNSVSIRKPGSGTELRAVSFTIHLATSRNQDPACQP